MRKLMLGFAGVALMAGMLAWAMLHYNSYLLIALGDYSIEMSLWTGVALLLFVYLLIRCIAGLWRYLARSGKTLLSANWLPRRDKAKTAQGLVDYFQGHWLQARQNLLRGAKSSESPLVNYLGAALAAHHLGDRQQARDYLRQAEAVEEGSAAERVKVRLLLKDRDYRNALLMLQQMQKRRPGDGSLIPLLVEARRGLSDWDGLQKMLPELKRHKIFAQYPDLQRQLYLQLLQQGDSQPQVWQQIPTSLKRDPEILAAYVQGLPSSEAEKLLRKALRQQWDDRLVTLYGELEGEDVSRLLHTAEGWLEEHQDSANLLAVLGKLSQKNQLWGKARSYFKQSLAIKPQLDVYAQLGALLHQLGERQQSSDCYRDGLMAAVNNKS